VRNITEADRPRRPTGFIAAPANANFALGSDAERSQLKVLYHATGGQGVKILLTVML